MIQIINLNKKFGKKALYQHLSITLPETGVVCLTGESGCGKTTLLRILAGLDQKYSGKIDLSGLSRPAYVFQEPRLLPASDALENVALPLGNTAAARDAAVSWLIRLGLGEDLHTLPGEMSGGMKQRVSLARAFAYGGDYLLLDEPLNGLDHDRALVIMDIIKEYAQSHLCLVVTHHQEQADYLGATCVQICGIE